MKNRNDYAIAGDSLLLDAANLTLQFANLNFDFLYGIMEG